MASPDTSATAAANARKSANDAITKSEFEAQIATLREEMSKLVAQAQSSGERSYGAAKRAASAGARELRARGESAIEDARATAYEIEDQVAAHVREKPVSSLAIAAGVGFLFALIARR